MTDPSGDRPQGLGYIFFIGRTFTFREGEDFVFSLACPHGDCWEQWELHTRYGNRILDLYDPFFEWMHEVKTGYQSSAALQMQARKDNWLLNNNGGWSVLISHDFSVLHGGARWFLPGQNKTSGSSVSFFQRLSNYGINILWFIYKKGTNDKAYNNSHGGTGPMAAAAASHHPNFSVYGQYPSDGG